MKKVKLQQKTHDLVIVKYITTIFAFVLVVASILIDRFTVQKMRKLSIAGTLSALAILACFIKIMPTMAYCASLIFIMFSTYCGSLLEFYGRFTYYDLVIHFISGVLLVILAELAFNALYNKTVAGIDIKSESLKRCILYLFCVAVSIAGAGLWEIYEFSIDQIFPNSHCQGNLADTMTDMIAGTLGAGLGILIIHINYTAEKKKTEKALLVQQNTADAPNAQQ